MFRRSFILAGGALALTGCEMAPAQVASIGAGTTVATAPAAAATDELSFAAMKLTEVTVQERRGGGRPFNFGGLPSDLIYDTLSRKTRAAVNAANPGGTRPTRAIVTVNAITIATAGGRKSNYDSAIIGSAEFFDVATGAKIGRETLGAQATYRPAFLGGEDKVLTPKEELELITTHSTSVLAKQLF